MSFWHPSASNPHQKAMGKLRASPDANPQIEAYRDLAREALESVAIYNARAQWFECSGNENLATEYHQLSHEALERAQRYKELADLSDEQLKRLRFETLGKQAITRADDSIVTPISGQESKSTPVEEE